MLTGEQLGCKFSLEKLTRKKKQISDVRALEDEICRITSSSAYAAQICYFYIFFSLTLYPTFTCEYIFLCTVDMPSFLKNRNENKFLGEVRRTTHCTFFCRKNLDDEDGAPAPPPPPTHRALPAGGPHGDGVLGGGPAPPLLSPQPPPSIPLFWNSASSPPHARPPPLLVPLRGSTFVDQLRPASWCHPLVWVLCPLPPAVEERVLLGCGRPWRPMRAEGGNTAREALGEMLLQGCTL